MKLNRCQHCNKAIRFIRRKSVGLKALIVDYNPVYFVPDSSGDIYVIHNRVMRRGTIAPDGLQGYILHNCQE